MRKFKQNNTYLSYDLGVDLLFLLTYSSIAPTPKEQNIENGHFKTAGD